MIWSTSQTCGERNVYEDLMILVRLVTKVDVRTVERLLSFEGGLVSCRSAFHERLTSVRFAVPID